MSHFIGSLTLVSLVLVSLVAYGDQQATDKEYIIGGFDFSKKLMKNTQLVSLLGKGCVDKDYPVFYSRRYYFPKDKVYAAFLIETDNEVVGLRLTSEPIVPTNCKAKRRLSSFKTGKWIALGDEKNKVVNAYGKPTYEIQANGILIHKYYRAPQDDTVEEGPYMEIQFIKDRVISILITVGD